MRRAKGSQRWGQECPARQLQKDSIRGKFSHVFKIAEVRAGQNSVADPDKLYKNITQI